MAIDFLKYLVIIFGVSAVVVFLLNRIRIPSIVGFLLAGLLLGPHGLELIRDVHTVEVLAEIGVILLMFTIGLEFSLRSLIMLRTAVFGGGLLQVLLTIFVIAWASYLFYNQSINNALFDGFLVSLSSTAIGIKILMDRGELNTPHGRTIVGILIFQDLCVVPFMLLTPILSGQGGGLSLIALTMGKALIVISLVFFSARWGVPHLLHEVVKTRSRELFLITIILLCLATALLTQKLGLSLALGAFLAGIVISESEYSSQAIADILPFKESFTGLFFISVGMLMDTAFFLSKYIEVILLVCILIVAKIAAAFVASLLIGVNARHSIQSAFYLAQIGEFSFVLAMEGKKFGLIADEPYQIFLSASVITMVLTPLMVSLSTRASNWVASKEITMRLERFHRRSISSHEPQHRWERHVIVVGFGVNGKNLATVLKGSGIPYVVLELNPVTVRLMKRQGEPIFYGDSTNIEILHKVGIHKADMLVVVISDAAATRKTVQIARQQRKDLHIIVRTRFLAEVDELLKLGANEVIPEEFETSVEIFSRVLHHYHVPTNVINEHVEAIRSDNYRALRTTNLPAKSLGDRHHFISDINTETFLVKEGSPAAGFSIKELNLRSETGATIIAMQRKDKILQNPSPETTIQAHDILLLIGTKEQLQSALEYLASERLLIKQYN
jgi:CPA2 family monovalent cation:H+ antiporter-2